MFSANLKQLKLIVLVILFSGIGFAFQNCGSPSSNVQADGLDSLSDSVDDYSDCNASDFLCEAYGEILGRLPDQSGALYYSSLINSTTTDVDRTAMYTTIVNEMINSPEANGQQPLPSGTVMCTGTISCY